MSYATVTDIRNRGLKFKDTTTFPSTDDTSKLSITTALAMASEEVETDLSAMFSVPYLQSLSPVPVDLKLLTIYKTCEILLVNNYSPQRTTDSNGSYTTNDIPGWADRYNKHLQKILNSEIIMVSSTGAVLDTNDDGIVSVIPNSPDSVFGMGENYGPDQDEDMGDIQV